MNPAYLYSRYLQPIFTCLEDRNPIRVVCTLPVLLMLVVLSGCVTPSAGTPPAGAENPAETAAADPVAPEVEAEAEEPAPEDYPVRPFEGDALYDLLVAEVAGYRSDYDTALSRYMEAAELTRDPGVAARATRLALYMKKEAEALQAARIWVEGEPRSLEAHRHVADLLLRAGQLDEAVLHMETIKNLGGLAKFDLFAYRAASLSPEDRASLLSVITSMLDRHPGDEQLIFSRAVLLEQSGLYEESLALTEELLTRSENVNVVILKMSLLNSLERQQDARAFMESQLEVSPDNRRFRLMLARLLFELNDLDAARMQYEKALEQTPNDGDVLFALALIALESEDDAAAERYLQRMVRWNRRAGEAHYYLGSIAERRSDIQTALREYRQAGTGYEFIPAHARIASLLAAEGRWDEAREHLARMRGSVPTMRQQLIMVEAQLLAERGMEEEVLVFLEEVLAEMPDNIELLYFRAMTGQRFGRLDILERDLRRIIDIDPMNADALNALGYTLADQTERYEEALELIERALAIRPDEPAFIDSLGWVQYRLNNYEEAITHLRRALSLFQNDEVASHLGEVLWMSGQQDEARQVWNRALEFAPDSEILRDVIQRFTQ
ncbi:MAG: tetratricopeptide repeat protein [Proteobacteria bacterium]|nr:tetratricopeptide repeat protein [Pseudomonadota bacterium]